MSPSHTSWLPELTCLVLCQPRASLPVKGPAVPSTRWAPGRGRALAFLAFKLAFQPLPWLSLVHSCLGSWPLDSSPLNHPFHMAVRRLFLTQKFDHSPPPTSSKPSCGSLVPLQNKVQLSPHPPPFQLWLKLLRQHSPCLFY